MIKKKSMKKRYILMGNSNLMMKRKKRGEIREKAEKLGLKGEEERWWVVQGSTSAPSKRLHTLKRREITFCVTSAHSV
ncbi:hypothetical protein MTR67_008395 [Solanum verrucosum]|uniref:Uncharacterized protein n=1 Tax=Solanum verrucosum TaxID=315347 RepID=A0AAF0TJ83_SOLVR|nr:hypothetical protein MTR67_008395 [Solanum verrucosum]